MLPSSDKETDAGIIKKCENEVWKFIENLKGFDDADATMLLLFSYDAKCERAAISVHLYNTVVE